MNTPPFAMMTQVRARALALTMAAACALLQGCATAPGEVTADIVDPIDPYEKFNRTIFKFNDRVDTAVVKPVAVAYRKAAPEPLRKSVSNFFANIVDVWSLVNNALQLKPVQTADQLFRVTTNTLWGVGGLFDVASDIGIPKHTEDFGQTLGYWGVGSGPYLVLPLFGPSTLRDSFGMLVDLRADLISNASNVPARNSLTGLRLVDTRSNFLSAGNVLDEAALDKYTFSREIFLQRRRSLIERGKPEKEERYDLPEATGNDKPPKEERFDLPEDAPANKAAAATAAGGAAAKEERYDLPPANGSGKPPKEERFDLPEDAPANKEAARAATGRAAAKEERFDLPEAKTVAPPHGAHPSGSPQPSGAAGITPAPAAAPAIPAPSTSPGK